LIFFFHLPPRADKDVKYSERLSTMARSMMGTCYVTNIYIFTGKNSSDALCTVVNLFRSFFTWQRYRRGDMLFGMPLRTVAIYARARSSSRILWSGSIIAIRNVINALNPLSIYRSRIPNFRTLWKRIS